jgi:hypothetical protein
MPMMMAKKEAPEPLPSLFERFDRKGIKWCRYCGTCAEVHCKGIWEDNSLCKTHASENFDLSLFQSENSKTRKIPIIQDFCFTCLQKSPVVKCNGCYKAFHDTCALPDGVIRIKTSWFCGRECLERNIRASLLPEWRSDRLLPFEKSIKIPLLKIPKHLIVKPRRAKQLKVPDFTKPERVRKASTASLPSKKVAILSLPSLPESVEEIKTPTWSLVDFSQLSFHGPRRRSRCSLSDEGYTKRHCRYEKVEMTTRLLNSKVLESLQFPNK